MLIELSVERVDFIKIDVEGSELEVLGGLTRTLKRYRPKSRQIAPQYLCARIFCNIKMS
ncbi:MAG: FkbM family methyltransferase [Candidatus Bathyarchaeia archaeon]